MTATRTRRPVRSRLALAGACAVAVVALIAGVITVASGDGDKPSSETARERAVRLADSFLDRYVDPDGRVVRRDQGGDTVSEGQAYALLLAVGSDDRERFERVWKWTRENLQRRDGLHAVAWRDGRVSDPQPATDADLDTARALLIASRRFDEPEYRAEALRIAHAIIRSETKTAHGKRVLLAGPWAEGDLIWNPSYSSPRTYELFSRAGADPEWSEVADGDLRLARRLLEQSDPPLPSNWAQVNADGVVSVPAPGTGDPPSYGYDAVRFSVRLAESCDRDFRALAAKPWGFLSGQDRIAPVYSPDGQPAADGEHPSGLVGAAGAAQAAGDRRAADRLLGRAESADKNSPTYYGAAWAALGPMMLQTDLLGGCPRGS